jgi:tetratricopeptide (TPR) repeat protein
VLHGQRALLLMDNARDAEQVLPLIPPDTCVLLVTSRWRFALPGLISKDLDELPPEDARKLLLRIAPRIDNHADEIARLCGYLPLALRLAASALSERRDLSPADYLRRLSDEQQRLKLLDKVVASLSLSYDLLTPDLQKLWRALAVFPATFDAPAAAAVWEMEQDATQDALGELVKYSLLNWDDTTARYSLHDLARLLADKCLTEEERYASQARHAVYYVNVLSEADDLYLQGGEAFMRGLALFDAERTNIQGGQSWAANYADDDKAALLCSRYPTAGIYVLQLRLHPSELVEWLGKALSAAHKLNHRDTEEYIMGNLGNAYAILGKTTQAIKFFELLLARARERGDQHIESQVLSSLGNTYDIAGDLQRSIDFHEQGLLITKEIGDKRGEGIALGNLGRSYKKLDEPLRAVEFYKQALAIMHECGDLQNVGGLLWNLSLAFDSLGDRNRAIAHAEAALKIREQIEDPNAAMVRKQLAIWRGQTE